MKSVLITGAYGFVGRYVALEFKRNGYWVVGIGHGDWKKEEQEKWGINVWHDRDIDSISLSMCNVIPEYIVHCAGTGSVGFSISNCMEDFDKNVRTTQCVLDFVQREAPRAKVVFLSSAAVYGKTERLPISETDTLSPISPYGLHKKVAEELCVMACQQYGIEAIILRAFSIYGNGLRKQLLWDACVKISQNKHAFWGSGEETRDWIHVEDVARLIFLAKDRANVSAPVVNVGTGTAQSISEVLAYIYRFLAPGKSAVFTGKENPGNPTHYCAAVSRISGWGWKPQKSMEEGIREYVAWYMKESERIESCVSVESNEKVVRRRTVL